MSTISEFGPIPLNRAAGAIGAEITEIDIKAGLDEAHFLAIRDAVLRHAVIVLRNQHLTPAQQLAFTNRLALVNPSKRPAGSMHAPTCPGFPELVIISNIVENGRAIGISDAGLLWHTDTCFQAAPELFVTLNALEIPMRDGVALGDTRFVSTTSAYDALDEAMKRRLDALRVVQSYAYHLDLMDRLGIRTRAPLDDEQRRGLPQMSHPLVRTHPITGRKLLYVNESFTAGIEGMDEDEARPLLAQLCQHISSDAFMMRHHWRAGDLLIWDNCATQHQATFDYGDRRRLLHRCGTIGPLTE